MLTKLILFKVTKGMCQDIESQSFNPESAYELYNIKLQTLENQEGYALVTEKGNSLLKEYTISSEAEIKTITTKSKYTINGKVLGSIPCTENKSVIITTDGSLITRIYKVILNVENQSIYVQLLAKGDFNIPIQNSNTNKDTYIQGIFIFENSSILKVYWIDGINLLRYINIADDNPLFNKNINTTGYITDHNQLDSCPEIEYTHKFEVLRIPGGGIFSSGVIQYAFTYFYKHGAETNVVDMTPLYYIGEIDKGVQADKTVGCSYKICLSNPDKKFDYARIYSILRTSIDSTPIIKIVKDIKLK